MPPCKLSKEQIDEIYRRAVAGEKIMPLAKEYGVQHGPLYSLLKRRFNYKSPMERAPTLRLPTASVELAYIAALIDGEGSITHDRTNPVIKVKMTHKGLIGWLCGFGGSSGSYEREGDQLRTVYSWSIQRKADVQLLLEATLPYLKIKHEKARQVLDILQKHVEVLSRESQHTR